MPRKWNQLGSRQKKIEKGKDNKTNQTLFSIIAT